MKFGLLLGAADGIEEAIDQAVYAEELGYDSVFVPEHHGYDAYVPQPLLALSAIAARTERVRLGPYVLLLPLYNPVQVAEETAMLDYISNGRFIFGVGLGYVQEEFDMYGVQRKDRAGRMEEALPLVRRLWREQLVDHDGEHFRFRNATVQPKPLQDPLPVWYGGWVEPGIRRAARLADSWGPGPTVEIETLSWGYAIYRDELEKQGKSLDREYPACRELFCGTSAEDARQRGGTHIYQLYKDTYLTWPHPHLRERERELTYEEIMENRFIVGDPEHCIRELERFAELGINHFILRMQAHGVTLDDAKDSMRLFAEEVMPHFKK